MMSSIEHNFGWWNIEILSWTKLDIFYLFIRLFDVFATFQCSISVTRRKSIGLTLSWILLNFLRTIHQCLNMKYSFYVYSKDEQEKNSFPVTMYSQLRKSTHTKELTILMTVLFIVFFFFRRIIGFGLTLIAKAVRSGNESFRKVIRQRRLIKSVW